MWWWSWALAGTQHMDTHQPTPCHTPIAIVGQCPLPLASQTFLSTQEYIFSNKSNSVIGQLEKTRIEWWIYSHLQTLWSGHQSSCHNQSTYMLYLQCICYISISYVWHQNIWIVELFRLSLILGHHICSLDWLIL